MRPAQSFRSQGMRVVALPGIQRQQARFYKESRSPSPWESFYRAVPPGRRASYCRQDKLFHFGFWTSWTTKRGNRRDASAQVSVRCFCRIAVLDENPVGELIAFGGEDDGARGPIPVHLDDFCEPTTAVGHECSFCIGQGLGLWGESLNYYSGFSFLDTNLDNKGLTCRK